MSAKSTSKNASLASSDVYNKIETELAVLVRLVENLSRKAVTYRKLDRSNYLVARALNDEGRISIRDLAKLLALDSTSVTRKIASMERDGLITRATDDADGRISLVGLSAKGLREVKEVSSLRSTQVKVALGEWSATDHENFARLLHMYNEDIRSHANSFMTLPNEANER